MTALEHSAGGKVKFPLQPGVIGRAQFSECGVYRFTLSRWWSDLPHQVEPFAAPYALWIGMNPSTAEADVDDPTIRWEMDYTRRMLGLSGYVKCNVGAYRATNPKDLAKVADPVGPGNLVAILRAASSASKIVAAYGAVPPGLAEQARLTTRALRGEGHTLWCLGTTKDLLPRHPLYMKKETPLFEYLG